MKWKAFIIIFGGLSLKQIKKSFFGRWEPDFNECLTFKSRLKTSYPSFNKISAYLHLTWHCKVGKPWWALRLPKAAKSSLIVSW